MKDHFVCICVQYSSSWEVHVITCTVAKMSMSRRGGFPSNILSKSRRGGFAKMSRRGGFPSNIFCDQGKSESFHCLVCTEVCRSPVTCRSGAHLFCQECLTESLRHNPSCPVCREPLTAPVPCAFASAKVSALDVQCVHDTCQWKGTCGRLDGHLDTDCLHEPIKCSAEDCKALVPRGEMATHEQFVCLQSCPNSKSKAKGNNGNEKDTCNVRLSRNDLADHLKDHCILRLTHCPHPSCEVATPYNRMPTHLETCPYAPVSCPLQCGAPKLIRQSVEAHKKDCPNEPVPCVHAPLGCSHVAPRGEIGRHEQDIGIHFVALSKAFVQQQETLRAQATLFDRLQAQVSLLDRLQAQASLLNEKMSFLQPMMAEAEAKRQAEADAKRQAERQEQLNRKYGSYLLQAVAKTQADFKSYAEVEQVEQVERWQAEAKRQAEARWQVKAEATAEVKRQAEAFRQAEAQQQAVAKSQEAMAKSQEAMEAERQAMEAERQAKWQAEAERQAEAKVAEARAKWQAEAKRQEQFMGPYYHRQAQETEAMRQLAEAMRQAEAEKQAVAMRRTEAWRQAQAKAQAEAQAKWLADTWMQAEVTRLTEAWRARWAEAKQQTKGIKCYLCGQAATYLYKNNTEPWRNDSFRINGFSGTCSTHIDCSYTTVWTQL